MSEWHRPTLDQIRRGMRWYITHFSTGEQKGYRDGIGGGTEQYSDDFSLNWDQIWGARWSWTLCGLSGVGFSIHMRRVLKALPPPMTTAEHEMLYRRLEGLGYHGQLGYVEPPPKDTALAEKLRGFGLAMRFSEDDCWYLTDRGKRIVNDVPEQTILEIRGKWVWLLLLGKSEGGKANG